jgi:hypothetical protein
MGNLLTRKAYYLLSFQEVLCTAELVQVADGYFVNIQECLQNWISNRSAQENIYNEEESEQFRILIYIKSILVICAGRFVGLLFE